MPEPSLAEAIAATAAVLSTPALAALAHHLRTGSPVQVIRDAVPATSYHAAIEDLLAAWMKHPGVTGESIALALDAVRESHRKDPHVSLVWTGPTTAAVPVRRTDQALLQLINRATRRLMVVSFAVYKVPNVAATLRGAVRRGVGVDLVVETQEASEGKITFDGWQELGGLSGAFRVWTWAHDRRPTTASGKLASLHAKCAVADGERMLVSSANLTEFALTLNMELGLLLSGGELPRRVESHFNALISTGELTQAAGF